MDAWMWVVLVAVVLIVFVLMRGRKAAIGTVNPTQISLEPAVAQEIKALALAGQQISAIKLLRDSVPGLGLAHAKNMVDRMAAKGQQPPTASPTDPGLN